MTQQGPTHQLPRAHGSGCRDDVRGLGPQHLPPVHVLRAQRPTAMATAVIQVAAVQNMAGGGSRFVPMAALQQHLPELERREKRQRRCA